MIELIDLKKNNLINLRKLVEFYKKGFFPMADSRRDKTINFFKPLKRFIIPINNFHVPKKLFSIFKKQKYEFKINTNFEQIIALCQKVQRKNEDTWINDIIINTYTKLYKIKESHSVECYENNKLVGGLYGVHLGRCFFGESMFSLQSNTSKLCLLYLIAILIKNKFSLLDSQFYNPHLAQFGAFEIPDKKYMTLLKKGLDNKADFKDLRNFQEALSTIQSISHKS